MNIIKSNRRYRVISELFGKCEIFSDFTVQKLDSVGLWVDIECCGKDRFKALALYKEYSKKKT